MTHPQVTRDAPSEAVEQPPNVWAASMPHLVSAPWTPSREIIWFAGYPVAAIGPARMPDSGILSFTRRSAPLAATDTVYTFMDRLGTPLLHREQETSDDANRDALRRGAKGVAVSLARDLGASIFHTNAEQHRDRGRP